MSCNMDWDVSLSSYCVGGDISVEFVNSPIPLALCQVVYYLWTILGMQHLP